MKTVYISNVDGRLRAFSCPQRAVIATARRILRLEKDYLEKDQLQELNDFIAHNLDSLVSRVQGDVGSLSIESLTPWGELSCGEPVSIQRLEVKV